MAWFFAPLVFFLFVGVWRFKVAPAFVELNVNDASLCCGEFLTKNWTFWLGNLSRRHVVSSNDYLWCLLLLSGDVALNPGPMKFPCVVCHFPVRSNQCALSCDDCGLWCHCRCCSVSRAQYQSFQLQSDFNWTCPSCLSKTLPLFS